MANYYGIGRTNYFRVKDEAAFREAVEGLLGVTLHTRAEVPTLFMLMSDDPDGGGWRVLPKGADGEADWDAEYVDIADFLAAHLADGEVAIVMESGHEKYRYVTGWAIAVNSRGERKCVSIDDIYILARDLTDRPNDITTATY
jgi:hypothetical protein